MDITLATTDRYIHCLTVAAFALGVAACSGTTKDSDSGPLDGKNESFIEDGKGDSGTVEPGTPEAAGVLEFVNQTTLEVLDDDVPLDVRAAEHIVEHRNGPDGKLGTSDDDLFDTLRELDDVYWVGPASFQRIVEYARDKGYLDRDTGGNSTESKVVSCGKSPSGAPSSPGCAVVQRGSGGVVLRGDVLRADQVFENGEVHVDTSGSHGTVSCAGCDCSSSTGANPTIIACSETSISPGLINAHDHLGWGTAGPAKGMEGQYEHRHEWRTGANGKEAIESPSSDRSREAILHGELRQLVAGTTSIAGSTSGAADRGLMRNLDNPDSTGGLDVEVEYSTFPLGDVSGTMKKDSCKYGGFGGAENDVLRSDIFLPHISEGIGPAASNEFQCLSNAGGESSDYVEDKTSVVHGIGMTADQIRELAANDGQLVWSPRTNIALYGDTADVLTYRELGVPVALATDWAISGSPNMLHELSCASRFNKKHLNDELSPAVLWKMATIGGAVSLGVADQVGRLQQGYRADIALYSGSASNPYRRVLDGHSGDVRLVMRDGRPLFGDAALVESATEAWGSAGSSDEGCTTLDVCGSKRLVCVERNTGRNGTPVKFDAVKKAAQSDAYPFFHCEGESLREPTCDPNAGTSGGSSTSSDRDGDQVRDSADSCPSVFNPVRPMASGGQLDADGDGAGDPCDPCPTDPRDMCGSDDFDGDGVPDDSDICPNLANPGQADSDGDGIGDACDHSATPYQVHDGTVGPPSKITLEEVLVTASGDDGAFVQVPSDAPSFDGAAGSGLYVDLGGEGVPEQGEVVTVRGRLEDFYDMTRVSTVRSIEDETGSATAPQPVQADPCSLASDGARKEKLLGALVEFSDVEVTSANPDSKDYGEFVVGDCSSGSGMRVDDQLHEITPDPKKGDAFRSIVGPLYYSFGNYKLEVRSSADVAR